MLPITPEELAWFEAGEAVFEGDCAPERFPPIDDPQTQRWWIGGFASAWAAAGQKEPPSPRRDPTAALCYDDVRVALSVALADHPDLGTVIFDRLGTRDARTRRTDTSGAPLCDRDQRQHPRVIYRDPVQVTLIGVVHGPHRHAVLAENLSEGGIAFNAPELFGCGTRLLMELEPQSVGPLIRLIGEVIWVKRIDHQERYRMGVRFDDYTDEVRRELQRLIAGLDQS